MLTLSRRCTGVSLALAGILTIGGCSAESTRPSPVGEPSRSSVPAAEESVAPSTTPESPTPDATATTPPATVQPPADGTTAAPQDPPGTASGGATVVPSIAHVGVADGQVVVNALVPGIVESTGRCLAEFSSGSVTRSTSGTATADATSTWCDPLSLASTELAPGTWAVLVRYSSTTSSGQSERFEVVIP